MVIEWGLYNCFQQARIMLFRYLIEAEWRIYASVN